MARPSPMRAVRVLLLAGAAVAATALPLPQPLQTPFAPSPVAAAGECVDGWRSMDLPPKTFPNSLFEAITREGEPAWLLGGSHSSGFLAFRWNDGSWVDAAVPSGGTRGLTGGVSTSATGLTAVGYIGAGDRIAAGRIRGGGWDAASVDAASRGASTFSDAAASRGTVWAVGSRATGGRMRALAMRLHRGRWDRRRSVDRRSRVRAHRDLGHAERRGVGRRLAHGAWRMAAPGHRPSDRQGLEEGPRDVADRECGPDRHPSRERRRRLGGGLSRPARGVAPRGRPARAERRRLAAPGASMGRRSLHRPARRRPRRQRHPLARRDTPRGRRPRGPGLRRAATAGGLGPP